MEEGALRNKTETHFKLHRIYIGLRHWRVTISTIIGIVCYCDEFGTCYVEISGVCELWLSHDGQSGNTEENNMFSCVFRSSLLRNSHYDIRG